MKLYEIIKVIEKIDPNTKEFLSKKINEKINNFKEIHPNIINDILTNIWNKK